MTIEHRLQLCEEAIVQFARMLAQLSIGSPTESLNLKTAERSLILAALNASNGEQKAAASLLGVSERMLHYRLKRLHLPTRRSKDG